MVDASKAYLKIKFISTAEVRKRFPYLHCVPSIYIIERRKIPSHLFGFDSWDSSLWPEYLTTFFIFDAHLKEFPPEQESPQLYVYSPRSTFWLFRKQVWQKKEWRKNLEAKVLGADAAMPEQWWQKVTPSQMQPSAEGVNEAPRRHHEWFYRSIRFLRSRSRFYNRPRPVAESAGMQLTSLVDVINELVDIGVVHPLIVFLQKAAWLLQHRLVNKLPMSMLHCTNESVVVLKGLTGSGCVT